MTATYPETGISYGPDHPITEARVDGYEEFLDRKTHQGLDQGFAPVWSPDFLFDFQMLLVEWSILRGRGAIFADCGLGKTPMQLVWAENVVRKTNGRVLILTPLAVSAQTLTEAGKFGIEITRSGDGRPGRGITVTNYERLHHFNPSDFAGVVCDESSILKSFDGIRRQEITAFLKKMPYRLLATATAAPNDHTELGTSSEALGDMGHVDMLSRFFKNDQNTAVAHGSRRFGKAAQWRFKGHAERPFWRWVCSWARAMRRPSDLGCDDSGFILPPLRETEHVIVDVRPPDGMLFSLPAVGMREEREENRRTLTERCERAAALVADTGKPALVWCHLNPEGDLLEKMIPGAIQVAGSDSDDQKEERLIAFARGEARVLVTKPKIGAWGLNFQHCSHVVMFPSHSFEQYYQAIRRCWRFGQKNPVQVDLVISEGGRGALQNLQQKAERADRMFSHLAQEMKRELGIAKDNPFKKREALPPWL